MQVVILGMHRSGTSLLASILVELGVNMGDNLLMRGINQPYGHWEDRDFVTLNKDILRSVGSRWSAPPTHAAILRTRGRFSPRIAELIERKDKRDKWGWKDPRTSLTVDLYHPHLVTPRYIRIVRDRNAIAESLKRRHRGGSGWAKLCDLYVGRIAYSLASKSYLVVTHEALVGDDRVSEIEKINLWVDGNGKIDKAAKRVKI